MIGRGKKKLEYLSEFENARSNVKNVVITEKEERKVSQINHVYQPGAFTYSSYP